jgi:cytidylate kinase
MIITIDGLSGCGKSSVARLLCQEFDLPWLDSGAIYRILAYIHNEDSSSLDVNLNKLKKFDIKFTLDGKIFLNSKDISCDIRNTEIAEMASKIAKNPLVRKELLIIQQNFIGTKGLIADGRDMGTVVFPNADLKIFLTANVKNRAHRRQEELQSMNKSVSIDSLIASINKRDRRDLEREASPVIPADDAIIIDTSALSLLQVVTKCRAEINKIIGNRSF